MKLIGLALATFLGGLAGAGAQEPEAVEPPRTRLGAFAGQSGVVIVRGYSRVAIGMRRRKCLRDGE